jgi:hypothetical protein
VSVTINVRYSVQVDLDVEDAFQVAKALAEVLREAALEATGIDEPVACSAVPDDDLSDPAARAVHRRKVGRMFRVSLPEEER